MRRPARLVPFAGLFLLLAAGSPVSAQLPPGLPIPPENFIVTHPLAVPFVIGARHLAMGSAFVADDEDGWHGNAAGMITVKKPSIFGMYQVAPFGLAPTLRSGYLAYAQPVGKRDVVKVSFGQVDGDGVLRGGPVPVRFTVDERDLGVEWAHRVSDRFIIGFGSGYLGTESSYSIDGVGEVTKLRSHPYEIGGRLGAIYRLHPKWSVGATYDNYTEVVDRDVPAFPVPGDDTRFHSTAYRVGFAFRPDRDTTVLFDYDNPQVEGSNGTRIAYHRVGGGVERRSGRAAFRAGVFDGRLTGGLGYQGGGYSISYSFTGKYGADIRNQDAGIAHALQILIEL